jgi:hypothetical protein
MAQAKLESWNKRPAPASSPTQQGSSKISDMLISFAVKTNLLKKILTLTTKNSSMS